jgi:GxxExxY protein
MNTEKKPLLDKALSEGVLFAFYSVYRELGYGFLESVYENSLALLLRRAGWPVIQQAAIDVRFQGELVGNYRADLLIPGRLLIEVKSATQLVPVHDAQLLNYLKATATPLGMLLNFGPRPEFRRKIHC